jgi:hypothetical protein
MSAAVAPRLALILMWIVGPRVNAAFDTFIVPLLGLIFLPYTTIMWVLVWSPVTGVYGWDWVWIGLGVMLDAMKWGQIFNKRREVPGLSSASDSIRQMPYEAELPRSPEPTVSDTDAELEKLADLRDKGIISDEEFDQKKKQLLGL